MTDTWAHEELTETKFPGLPWSGWEQMSNGAVGDNMGFTEAVEAPLVLVTHGEGVWAQSTGFEANLPGHSPQVGKFPQWEKKS